LHRNAVFILASAPSPPGWKEAEFLQDQVEPDAEIDRPCLHQADYLSLFFKEISMDHSMPWKYFPISCPNSTVLTWDVSPEVIRNL